MMIRQHMVCVICVYGSQPGRTEAEKGAFREEVETLAGLSENKTMLFVAGDFNTHIVVVEPGDEESIGRFGWGTMNREGRELVEMLRRNGLRNFYSQPYSRYVGRNWLLVSRGRCFLCTNLIGQ